MTVLEIIVSLVGLYLAVGILIGFGLLWMVAPKADPALGGSPKRVRILLLPGTAVLWPVLVGKWLNASKGAES